MCHGYLEISEMLSLPEMREAGDPLVGVGHGVAASTSSVGGVVVRHLTAVSETVWTGINYRSLQYIYIGIKDHGLASFISDLFILINLK